jgi:hypothetical protein
VETSEAVSIAARGRGHHESTVADDEVTGHSEAFMVHHPGLRAPGSSVEAGDVYT